MCKFTFYYLAKYSRVHVAASEQKYSRFVSLPVMEHQQWVVGLIRILWGYRGGVWECLELPGKLRMWSCVVPWSVYYTGM